MNRAFFIIMMPALLVAGGYIVVLRTMGFAPGYSRLIIAIGLFFAATFWFSGRTARRVDTRQTQITKMKAA